MFTASRRRSTVSSILATLLSGVMALQFMLAGSGMLCAMSHRESMAGMQMGPRTATTFVQQLTATGTAADPPCDRGHGVPIQCVSMAACAPSALPSTAPVVPGALRVPSVVVSAPAVTFFSHTSAPELPPPRA